MNLIFLFIIKKQRFTLKLMSKRYSIFTNKKFGKNYLKQINGRYKNLKK